MSILLLKGSSRVELTHFARSPAWRALSCSLRFLSSQFLPGLPSNSPGRLTSLPQFCLPRACCLRPTSPALTRLSVRPPNLQPKHLLTEALFYQYVTSASTCPPPEGILEHPSSSGDLQAKVK